MVKDYEANDIDVKLLLDTFDYYIVPQLNADGYKYTWMEVMYTSSLDIWRN